MLRKIGTTLTGKSFNEQTELSVWKKGEFVKGVDPSKRRKDTCGAFIDWDNYGETIDNGTGWEIDHIKPVSKNGTDYLSNLQPLQWQNNRYKGDDFPDWSCLKGDNII